MWLLLENSGFAGIYFNVAILLGFAVLPIPVSIARHQCRV